MITMPTSTVTRCSGAINLTDLVSPISGTTVGASNALQASCGGSGPEIVYYITVPAGFALQIGMTYNDYDSRHELLWGGDCPGENIVSCVDDPDTQTESWTNMEGSDQTVFFMIDVYRNRSGTFELAWSCSPGNVHIFK